MAAKAAQAGAEDALEQAELEDKALMNVLKKLAGEEMAEMVDTEAGVGMEAEALEAHLTQYFSQTQVLISLAISYPTGTPAKVEMQHQKIVVLVAPQQEMQEMQVVLEIKIRNYIY